MEYHDSADFAAPGADALWHGPGSSGFVTGAVMLDYPGLRAPMHQAGWQPMWWYRGPVSGVVRRDGSVFAAPQPALPAADAAGRRLPVWYKADVPGEGLYTGEVTICGEGGEALVFVGRRRLAWRGVLAAGEQITVPFVLDVVPLISEGDTDPWLNPAVDVTAVGAGLRRLWVESAPGTLRRVFLLGDSTVTDQSAAVPYAPFTSYAGWGEMLGWFLPEGFCVSNHAHSGLTTETFETEGHWAIVEARLRTGDWVLLQFGHNDQKLPHLTAEGGYTERMRRYIERIRRKGAAPVLVTPLARNSWADETRYNDLLADYAAAVFRLGAETSTPVIDLHAYAMQAIKADGREASKAWFYPGDYTHPNDFGAYKAAGFIGGALGRILGVQPPARGPWLPCGVREPLAPPADLKQPAAGDPYAGYDDAAPLTRADTLSLVTTALHLFPVNGYRSPFADVVGASPFAGAVQCAVQNNLIPPAWGADGCLHPARAVTLGEFLAVLMPGYAIRCTVPGTGGVVARARSANLLPEDLPAEPGAPLSRAQAVAVCRRVKI